MPLSKQQPLAERATDIHCKMENAWLALSNAASALYSLEEHYDLTEPSIDMCNHTYNNMDELLHKLKYEIDEAENWMFNGYSLQEIDEDEEE